MSVLAGSVLLLLAAAVVAGTVRRRAVGERVFRLLVAGACALGAVPAIAVLAGGAVSEVRMPAAVPGGAWVFGIDALSAIFLLAIFGAGAASALYGVAYLGHDRDASRATGAAHALFAILLAALVVVVTARAAVPFLIGWEMMAVVAYLMIVYEHERRDVRRAGFLYLVATHTSTLALFALFAVWGSGARDWSFAALAARAPLASHDGAAVFGLALVGFGLKAGVVPLHFWLPEAHAAAPSHVSAILSGVVIKMGVYGLMRVAALLTPPPAWWGWLVLGLGVASGVLGVVWALAQHDIKRLLAFHSVENIGIILLGLGAGALGAAYGHPVMAVLGFAGAALHTLNHALFKSLLFLGAGAVGHATGTRDIERLGGIATHMPTTAAAFLVGSAAIVGLPPLNGFVSEWLVYRSLLSGGAAGHARFAILAAAALALIGGLALACFAKVAGVVYLGTPRDARIATPHEAPRGMTGPLVALAGACAVIGLVPVLVLPPVLRVGALLTTGSTTSPLLPADAGSGAVTAFALGLAGALALVWAARRGMARRAPRASAETWACGYIAPTARMQYTASSFAAPLVGAFHAVAGVREHRAARTFATHAVDPVLDGLMLPAWHRVRAAADRLRPIQRGRLALYLLYIVAAVIVLLLYLLAGRTS